MKKSLKLLLLVLVLVISISMVVVFSLGGCRRAEEPVAEEITDKQEAEEITTESKIAFTSDRDGNMEIYIMNLDGSEQTNLTNNPAEDSGPYF